MKLAPPVSWRSGRTSTPAWRIGTTMTVRPLCFDSPLSVRTRASPMSANWAFEVQTFWPLRIQTAPSRSALVRTAGEVGAGLRLGEQLARHGPALLDRHREPLDLVGGAAGGDPRAHGGQPDPEGTEVGHVVARLERPVGTVEVDGQATAAVLDGTGDPPEPVLPLGGLPCLGGLDLGELLVTGRLVEDREALVALAPRERLGLTQLRHGVEELAGLVEERVDGRRQGHHDSDTWTFLHRRNSWIPQRPPSTP